MTCKLIVFIHYRTYKKVIYKDDGRDYVDKKEFVSIHVFFSVLHSWITYFCIFNFFKSITIILFNDGPTINDTVLNLSFEYWGVAALLIMLIEMCVSISKEDNHVRYTWLITRMSYLASLP